MKEILDVIHNTIYQFFDVCGDDEEIPMSDKDKLLLEVNKAICNNLKELTTEVNKPQGEWIPVNERLPENAKHKGAFCPKYYVMTEFGQTEGWYNPDVGCWYVLLWFMDARFETWNISLERGDVPKLVKNVPVTAWMPLPKPYEPQESEE